MRSFALAKSPVRYRRRSGSMIRASTMVSGLDSAVHHGTQHRVSAVQRPRRSERPTDCHLRWRRPYRNQSSKWTRFADARALDHNRGSFPLPDVSSHSNTLPVTVRINSPRAGSPKERDSVHRGLSSSAALAVPAEHEISDYGAVHEDGRVHELQ